MPPTQISIALSPADYRWITWIEHKPLSRPKCKPFNSEEALPLLQKALMAHYGYRPDWHLAHIALNLSVEEAHFWFYAMTGITEKDYANMEWNQRKELPQKFPPKILELDQQAPFSLDEIRARLIKVHSHITPEFILPLYHLLSLEDLVKLLTRADGFPLQVIKKEYYSNYGTCPAENIRNNIFQNLITGFRTFVLPYLTPAEIAQLRELLGPLPGADPAEEQGYYRFAALIGRYDAVHALLQEQRAVTYYMTPQEIVFGLENSEQVVGEMRRLNLFLETPEQIRAWLALTGLNDLDLITRSILTLSRIDPDDDDGSPNWTATRQKQLGEEIAPHIKVLALVNAPETACPMLELYLRSANSLLPRQWLFTHPEFSVAGLAPLIDEKDKFGTAVLDWLRIFSRKGYNELIRAQLPALSPAAAAQITAEILENSVESIPTFAPGAVPTWLEKHLPDAKTVAAKKPAWVDPVMLPPIIVNGCRLDQAQTEALLVALKLAPLAKNNSPLFAGLKKEARRDTLGNFVWELFDLWLKDNAPSNEKWAMKALGLLGDDNVALKLTPMIRRWPGESQNPRAVMGLECLEAIGTDLALMQINGIAQKVPFKALKARAQQAMEAIAKERRLTRAELEDRIIPDCGLDEKGGRSFDFGPRQFKFALSSELKPLVRGDDGKPKTDLPKPNSKDDPEKSAQAVADWKLLKKQIREIAGIQAVRLEQAMITERRWHSEEFQLLFVHHPLMVNLARMLLWGGYDAEGRLSATFRITEDQTFADASDDPLPLSDGLDIGIVHPLHLADEQKGAWGELFSDYEILPPFPQLSREVYFLTAEELKNKTINRWDNLKIPSAALIGTLEKLGWFRGAAEDAGVFYTHSRLFPAADITAVVEYDGVPMGSIVDWEDQEIQNCFFLKGQITGIGYTDGVHKKSLPLAEIPALILSEVLRDLTIIAGKGK